MWPLSFFFSILAGGLVLFHRCASSETGDIALNKIISASGRRLSTVFDDAVCSPAGQIAAGYLVSREKADSLQTRCSESQVMRSTDPVSSPAGLTNTPASDPAQLDPQSPVMEELTGDGDAATSSVSQDTLS